MIKRMIWLTLGVVIGATGSHWANRKVKSLVDRYAPREIRHRVEDRVRTASGHVRSAVDEGRQAMRDREAHLKGVNRNSSV